MDPNQRPSSGGFQRLAVVTVGMTLLLVALGGAVRATGSGLACPDWPFCYGKIIPRQADIPPETTYTLWNVWLEHTHRLTASIVGFLVLGLFVWALARYRDRPGIVVASLLALVLVMVQALLGAAVVLNLLRASLVTAHLGLAMIVLACLLAIAVTAAYPRRPEGAARLDGYTAAVGGVALLSLAQILIGGQMTGTRGASLAYTDFPLMGGSVLPAMDTTGQLLHVLHRYAAVVLTLAVIWLCWRAVRERRQRQDAGAWSEAHRWLVTLPMWAATLTVLQVVIGAINLATRTHPAVVTAHLAVSSWIWALLALAAILAHRLAPMSQQGSDTAVDHQQVRT